MSTGQISGQNRDSTAVNPPPEVVGPEALPGSIKSIDELYRSIQQEILFYKREHEAIRADLSRLIQSNRVELTVGDLLTGSEGDGDGEAGADSGGKDQEYYKRISNEVINNLRNQLEIVWEEKNTLESLWKSSQKTIQILELEIGEYRRQLKQPKSLQDLRQHYTAALELLQQNLLSLRTKLVQRTEENKRLQATGAAEQDRLRTLERDFSALQTEHQQLRDSLEEFQKKESKLTADLEQTMKEKAELEALLDQANALARKHMARENQALAKVQEALQIADTAIDEKNTLVVREKDVREECNFLASTIGQVMEEAAHKVELEMNSLRMGYEGRITALEKQVEQVKEALDVQLQKTRQAEGRATTLEDKFKALIVTNQNLDADLHAASKLIIEMELKLEAFQKTMAKEREISKTSQAREQELKQLLETNEQLKDRWKSEMLTLTDGLQRKLASLRRENCMLKAENNQLKDQLVRVAGEDHPTTADQHRHQHPGQEC